MNYLQDYTVGGFFSLSIAQKTTSTKIIMQVQHDRIMTSEVPDIVELLNQHLPTVLLTTCYNDDNLPFTVEVKNTEIGHLFEHILLEYLCQLKIAKGHRSAVFSGRTRWNWIRDPKGKFHISLNCGAKDADILPIAIKKTNTLMQLILKNDQTLNLIS